VISYLTAASGSHTTAGLADGVDWASFLGGGIVGALAVEVYHEVRAFVRRRRELSLASLLVRDELRANIVQLEIALQGQEDPVGLRSETYDAYQMILATGLPGPTRDAVRQAYVHARVPRSLQYRISEAGSTVTRPSMIARDALEKAKAAHLLLASHIPQGASDV
jgi:hypothetical protein